MGSALQYWLSERRSAIIRNVAPLSKYPIIPAEEAT